MRVMYLYMEEYADFKIAAIAAKSDAHSGVESVLEEANLKKPSESMKRRLRRQKKLAEGGVQRV